MVTDDIEQAENEASGRGFSLKIDFDNDTEPDATVITVSGQDHTDLLSQMTAAFNSLDMVVHSATISTDNKGQVLDVFRVTEEDQKVGRPSTTASRKGWLWGLEICTACKDYTKNCNGNE